LEPWAVFNAAKTRRWIREDLMQRWTNGRFKSTVHRVLPPQPGQRRQCIGFFLEAWLVLCLVRVLVVVAGAVGGGFSPI